MSKRYATRDFKDSGTGRAFKLGDELKDVSEGSLGNYEAAGLASEDQPKAAKSADPVKTTEGGKTA